MSQLSACVVTSVYYILWVGRTEVIALLQESTILEGVNINSNKELGRGSYAAVYEAEWKGLSCVAKVFHPVIFPNRPTSTWMQLAREIKFLQYIRHPNIVQLLGFILDTNARIPSIIMERLDTNLTTLIEEHHSLLSFDTQVCILHDVAVGLNFLHSHKEPIIHRDLSSNNILITDHLVAKISDLGLAKHVKFTHQQAGSLAGFGAQDYMPPEVLGQKPPQISPKTDVFSFGVVMLHVATGKPPEVRGRIFVDAEKDRRKHHIDLVGENNLFRPLVLKCLSECSNRPTAIVLCETFKRFGVVRKSNVSLFKSFQEEFLKQILLVAEIKLTKEIGAGSFGKVFLSEYLGCHCAAKELNSNVMSTFEVNGEGTQVFKDNILRKCHRILLLRHPNIVQFIGVGYKPGFPTVPLLVMEMMGISLSVLLKEYPNIPINLKLTVLLDVSLGLKFLHCQKPSVVHCNLSSHNILLTPSLHAKISDVGMALIVPESSLKKFLKLTYFVAPEVSKPSAAGKISNPSVDVFSYGMITLHTITQQWPEPMKQPNSRISPYRSYIDKISSDDKELGTLVANCLEDAPNKRPVIDKVSENMEKMSEKYPATMKNSIVLQTELKQVKEQVGTTHTHSRISKIPYSR